MPEMSLTDHEEAFCLQHRTAYSIRYDSPLALSTGNLAYPRGGFLMSILAAKRRLLFSTIVLILASCLPVGAQEGRAFYTPPATDALHAVVAEHGMVVAQEK